MIEQVNSSITYIADGVQTEWEYPYPYVENDDINLYVTVDDVRTKISQDSFSFDSSTKKVTFPLVGEPVVSGAYVEISRETELTQLEDSSIVAFKSNDIERIADKLTMICQDTQRMVKDAVSPEGGQIQEAVAEAISVHNNSLSSHPLKEDKANKVTSISGSSTDTEYPSAKAVNTELNKKQPKTLTEAIVVEGATETTVEGALTAINNTINNNRANKSLSNLDENGENHFVQLALGVAQADVDYVIERGGSGTEWYEIWKSGRIRQGGRSEATGGGSTSVSVVFLKEMPDTNYTIQFVPIGNYTAQAEANDCVSAYSKTGMTFTSGHVANIIFSWVIEG